MTQLSGSLESFGLGPILRLLATEKKSGRVRTSWDGLTAEIYLADGQVVAAVFGEATGTGGEPSPRLKGIAALDAIALLMPQATFFFVEGAPRARRDIAFTADELDARLAALAEERAIGDAPVISLSAIPRRVAAAEQASVDEELTIDRNTLRLLLDIDGHRSVSELIGENDLLSMCRRLKWLASHGLIRLT